MAKRVVYWAELQNQLCGVGLNIIVEPPAPNHPWYGRIDEKPFTMSLAPKGDDGAWEMMMLSLYGQEEGKIIPLLSKFMAFEPFCRYLHKQNPQATRTYEWDKKDPLARFKEVQADSDVYELQKLENGFHSPQSKGVEEFYQQFTPEIVRIWEEAIQKNADVEYNCNPIKDILPFVRKVMPRVGKNQSHSDKP